jgi:hypothetical protein
MGNCYHHALSSVKKWGGVAEDYLPLHQWFDESKAITADFRHRALRHHAEGLMLERFFGATLTISESRMPGNWHVRFGEREEETSAGNGAWRFIPTLLSGRQKCEIPARWPGFWIEMDGETGARRP